MKLEAGWAGLYENTPDHNALIGRTHTPRNFLYATGFSGHGFLQAPAVGELVAELFLEHDCSWTPTHSGQTGFAMLKRSAKSTSSNNPVAA